ncbi:MAG: HAD-IA family hydrolase [Halofilum sp. (in: g-proteobacteria)]|nr:HAD-IA family hydrolase [Halofilum sp. (in: g-proteobacteria)]
MHLDRIDTLTFDVVGTLIDFETGILEWCRPWLRQHGRRVDDESILAAFAEAEDELQRQQPTMAFTSMLPHIQGALAARWEVDSDESSALDFRDSIRDWPAFADAVAGLRTLAERYRLVAVTNADRWAFERMSHTLGHPFAERVTCDEVGVNKPDPRVWSYVLEKLDAEAGQVLHCAQSRYHDLVSAQRFGLATAWIERRHGREGSGATPASIEQFSPDLHVHDLVQLVERLQAPAA